MHLHNKISHPVIILFNYYNLNSLYVSYTLIFPAILG